MTDAATVRKAIHGYVQANPRADYDTVVESVCATLNATEKRVCDEIEKLEQNGFLYLVESDAETVVKVA